jgi:hypothetical protein
MIVAHQEDDVRPLGRRQRQWGYGAGGEKPEREKDEA